MFILDYPKRVGDGKVFAVSARFFVVGWLRRVERCSPSGLAWLSEGGYV